MNKFAILISKINKRSKDEKTMEDVTMILDDMFEKLKEVDKHLYEDTLLRLEDIAYHIDYDDAKLIVSKMEPYGEKWDFDTIKGFIGNKGIDNHCIEYYLTMNMAYNDYHSLAVMVNKEEDAEFYFELAKDFINDVDARPHKVAKYFL